MDDIILVVGNAEEVRKRIKNCRKMETVKKSEYGVKKSKIMVVRNVKKEVEQIDMKEHSRAKQKVLEDGVPPLNHRGGGGGFLVLKKLFFFEGGSFILRGRVHMGGLVKIGCVRGGWVNFTKLNCR